MQEFNQSGGASRCIAILSIAQTRLVGVDCHQRIRGSSAKRRVASHGALAADYGFDGVELVEVERESVSSGRVEGVDHLTPGHRSESLRHNDILGAPPRDRDAAAIDDRAFEGFVLGVSQCRLNERGAWAPGGSVYGMWWQAPKSTRGLEKRRPEGCGGCGRGMAVAPPDCQWMTLLYHSTVRWRRA